MSLAHVQVICRLLNSLPATVDAATVAEAEAQMLDLARVHNPTDLSVLAKALKYMVEPDGGRELAALEARLDAMQEPYLTSATAGRGTPRPLGPETGAAERMPTTNGAAPTIIVTIPYATLVGHLGGAPATTLPNGHPMSASTARRLCCDGRTLPIVLGGKTQPLDAGRTVYAVSDSTQLGKHPPGAFTITTVPGAAPVFTLDPHQQLQC